MVIMFIGSDNYFVLYFWGIFGFMYNNWVFGLKEVLEIYGWNVYFEFNLRFIKCVGMYDVV